MASEIATEDLPRVFVFNGSTLADPDDDLEPDQVKRIYAGTYPALTNATISGPEMREGRRVYTFTAAVRTKG
jgi:PRTRC genetic system protein C